MRAYDVINAALQQNPHRANDKHRHYEAVQLSLAIARRRHCDESDKTRLSQRGKQCVDERDRTDDLFLHRLASPDNARGDLYRRANVARGHGCGEDEVQELHRTSREPPC